MEFGDDGAARLAALEGGLSELAELVATLIAVAGALNGHIALTAADPEYPDETVRRGQAIERELKALQARLSDRWPEATQ